MRVSDLGSAGMFGDLLAQLAFERFVSGIWLESCVMEGSAASQVRNLTRRVEEAGKDPEVGLNMHKMEKLREIAGVYNPVKSMPQVSSRFPARVLLIWRVVLVWQSALV